MQIKTDGLIIRDLNVGEDDRIVTILTRERGVVQASARGARRVKSRLSVATRLFCYSDFTLFKGREKYIIDDAETIEFFMGVDKNLERLALAQYFAQLCASLAPQEEPAEPFLRLMLNALSFIQNGKRPLSLIKAAFELRMLTMAGYMPDLVACRSCGAYEADKMLLEPISGTLLCCDCATAAKVSEENAQNTKKKPELSKGALAAMRHIVYAEFEKLFSFSLPDTALGELSFAVQEYLLAQLERSFPTLEFYNSLAGGV
jgi:DNA repair protein RecO (recombination protein O)